MGKRIKRNKIVSLVLTAFMMVSVFAVSIPQQAEAAGSLNLNFKNGKGKSTVTISDRECTGATNKIASIQFKPKVTGYITVKMTNASSVRDAAGFMYLCNNKKKAISHKKEQYETNRSQSWFYTRTFGVRKNKIYYLAVESRGGGVKVTANIKAASKSNANTQGKAKNLNPGKKVNGVIIAGENKADWYKFNIKNKKMIRVSLSAKTNGAVAGQGDGDFSGIKYTVYKSDGKKLGDDYASPSTNSTWSEYFKRIYYNGYPTTQTTGLDTGTYYIKVERHKNTSSGFYTLSWKYINRLSSSY